MTLSSSYQCPKWWYHYETKINLKRIRLVPSFSVNNFLHSECNTVQCTPAVMTTFVLLYAFDYPPRRSKSFALPWYEGNTHKRSGLFLCVHLHAKQWMLDIFCRWITTRRHQHLLVNVERQVWYILEDWMMLDLMLPGPSNHVEAISTLQITQWKSSSS